MATTAVNETNADILPAFNAWRRSIAQITGLGLDKEDREASTVASTSKQQDRDCKRCEQWRDSVIGESPIVRFMLSHIDALPSPSYTSPPATSSSSKTSEANSPVPIFCSPCGPDRGGGFAPNMGVILCQDRLMNKKHVEDTLAHELVHEWDHRRFNVDWGNLRMVACSEIRAASLSGDCRWGREIRRRNFGFSKQHQACTKRRAILSVMQHPSLNAPASTPTSGPEDLSKENARKMERASSVVNEVWNSCWNDTRPFDEIY